MLAKVDVVALNAAMGPCGRSGRGALAGLGRSF